MPYLCTYAHSRPSDELIQKELIAGRPYMYITATKALAHERRNLIPECMKDERKSYVLFGEFLRHLLRQSKIPFATRGEEKTFLQRALKNVSGKNQLLLDLFRKDSVSLLRVLYDLASQGIDLQTGPLPQEKVTQLVSKELGNHLVEVHKEFHDGMNQKKLALFDDAARKFLLNEFIPNQVVIMEGFTFLTELQKLFVQVCIDRGIEVYFVVPLHDKQATGFEIIQHTYQSVPNLTRMILETDSICMQNDLTYLQQNLFSNHAPVYTGTVSNLRMRQYQNRDHEILACIDQLRLWFSERTYKPNEVAIVMRRSKEFLDRFRDILAMNPLLYYPEGNVDPMEVQLFLPQRLLLLTPVGRFILTLYRIWENGSLRLSMEDLETILASGWLGPRIQDSASLFRAVKHQFFIKCETRQDWDQVLGKLAIDTRSTYERLPSQLLDRHTIRHWQEAVALLENVCAQLFVKGQKTIGEHIRLLQAELNKLLPKRIRHSEQEVLEQIQRVFTELSEYYSIEITAAEFGEALHALTRGSTEEEDEEGEEEDEDHVLRIVTPETIDGINKAAVMYVAVDSQHVPVLYAEPWPFYEDKRVEHVMKERYMFLTVIRSSQSYLWLSFSLKDGDRSYQRSAYLGEIERLMQNSVEVSKILDRIDVSLVKVPPMFPSPPIARRREYTLNELAHYALCPLRYRLELLHPEARVYRSEWQLSIVAQGIWLDKTYRALTQYQGAWPNPLRLSYKKEKVDQLLRFLIQAKENVKEHVRSLFPTFDTSTWIAIERKVEEQLNYHAETRGMFTTRIFNGGAEEIDILLPSGDNVTISFDVPYYLNAYKVTLPLLDYDLCHEWLLPGELQNQDESLSPEEQLQAAMVEVDGVDVFETQYHAVTWWRRTIQSHVLENFNYENNDVTNGLLHHRDLSEGHLERWIISIEQNHFPKHAGEHCITCPVRMECLGIKEEE